MTLGRLLARMGRLYEQGADSLRIGQYVQRWKRWTTTGLRCPVLLPSASSACLPDRQFVSLAPSLPPRSVTGLSLSVAAYGGDERRCRRAAPNQPPPPTPQRHPYGAAGPVAHMRGIGNWQTSLSKHWPSPDAPKRVALIISLLQRHHNIVRVEESVAIEVTAAPVGGLI